MKNFGKDFEAACRASKHRKAVGTISLDGIIHPGHREEVDIIKPLSGDATIYYKDSAFKIRRARPHEVDAIRNWRPFV